jgi:peptidoglycan/LPS O-acetylase OafA/YrhL
MAISDPSCYTAFLVLGWIRVASVRYLEIPLGPSPQRCELSSHFVMADKLANASVLNPGLSTNLSLKKIPSLDGLRAVAVLLVIFHHLHVPFSPDGRGVLTFFVLSGFLITWMLLNESERTGDVSIRNFYVRRILRIFPAFYVFLILSIAARWLTVAWPNRSLLYDYLSAFFYTINYRLALTPHIAHTAQHTWALSVEEQFYLLWPCVFVAFHKKLRRLAYVLVAAIVLINIYRLVLYFGFHARERWLTLSFDTRADHILIGCLLAVLLKRGIGTWFWNWITARTWYSLVPLLLTIASIAISMHQGLTYRYSVGFVLDPLLTAILLVQVIALGYSRLWGWLNWKVTVYLGKISYGMFLYHMLANHLVIVLFGMHSLWFRLPAVIAVTVLFGTSSYYLIENRFLRLKTKFERRDPRKHTAASLRPHTSWPLQAAPSPENS